MYRAWAAPKGETMLPQMSFGNFDAQSYFKQLRLIGADPTLIEQLDGRLTLSISLEGDASRHESIEAWASEGDSGREQRRDYCSRQWAERGGEGAKFMRLGHC